MKNTNNAIARVNPETVFNTSVYGFSQAVVLPQQGTQIFISGQFSSDLQGNVVGETMEEQMDGAFRSLASIMESVGAKPEHVVQIRTLVVDHKEEYLSPLVAKTENLFGAHQPASTLIPVPRLALDDMLFEIEATLFVPTGKTTHQA